MLPAAPKGTRVTLLLLGCLSDSNFGSVGPTERPRPDRPGASPDTGDFSGGGDDDGGGGDDDDPAVPEFGDAPDFTVIADRGDRLDVPRDLEFHQGDLWVVNRAFDGVVLIEDPGGSGQKATKLTEASTEHFMEEVSSLAFGGELFATCHESRNTYNGWYNPDDFMGPTLWDPELFGRYGGSTHMDMLHQSPNCMGIAHWEDNAYFVFDGGRGELAYYDFKRDHGPGNEDHSDGVIRRYSDVGLKRVADVPGHIEASDGLLYIADTGNGRVLVVDPSTAAKSRNLSGANEWLAEYSEYAGATVEVFSKSVDQPSGIAVGGARVFVSDYETGEIVAYDHDGLELDRIDTGAVGIMGLELGPDGHLWFVDGEGDEVVRVDPN